MGVPLEVLARHSRPIAALWWFGFLGGPVWVVILYLTRPRRAA